MGAEPGCSVRVGFDGAFLPACAAIFGSISMADISLIEVRLM